MPRQPIQPALDLVVKEAMADAESAFLKTFLAGAEHDQTLGEILHQITGGDLVDYSTLDPAEVQAVRGLLGLRIDQIKVDKKRATVPAPKKKSRRHVANTKGAEKGAAE